MAFNHRVEDFAPPLEGTIGVFCRRKARRRLDQTGQQRGLSNPQLNGVLLEEALRRSFDPNQIVAKMRPVGENREQFPPRESSLQLHCQADFLKLSVQHFRRCTEHRLRNPQRQSRSRKVPLAREPAIDLRNHPRVILAALGSLQCGPQVISDRIVRNCDRRRGEARIPTPAPRYSEQTVRARSCQEDRRSKRRSRTALRR